MKKLALLRGDLGSSLLVYVLLLSGLGLRLFQLTHQSLWWDEGFSLQNSSGDSLGENLSIVRRIYHADKFQPLYYWLLFGVRQSLGSSEAVLRGFSAVLGTLSLPVIYITARRLYGSRHALWSLGLAAFSAFLIYYSQEVRNYALLILLTALQLYCFSEFLLHGDRARASYRWGHAALVGLGLLGSIQMVVFSAGLGVAQGVVFRRWRLWLGWWLPALAAALPALIYFFTLPGTLAPDAVSVSRAKTPLLLNLLFTGYGTLVGTTFGPPLSALRGSSRWAALADQALPLALVGLVVGGLAFVMGRTLITQAKITRARQKKTTDFFACLLLFSALFGVGLALATGMNLVPRHAFYLWVPLAILLPAGLGESTKSRRLATVTLTALIGLNLYSISQYFFNRLHWRDDYRSVALYLAAHQTPTNATLLVSGEVSLIDYYAQSHQTQALGGRWVKKLLAGEPDWVEGLQEKAPSAPALVVAIYRPNRYGLSDLEADLTTWYQVTRVVDEFNGFSIVHLAARPVEPSFP